MLRNELASIRDKMTRDGDILLYDINRKSYKNENHVKAMIKYILDSFYSVQHFAFPGSAFANGVDRIACYRGFFIAIEAKFGKNKPTDNQRVWLTNTEMSGGLALCINEDNLIQLVECMVYVTKLPYGGIPTAQNPLNFGLSDYLKTHDTYRSME